MALPDQLDELVAAVRAGPRYRQVHEALVRRIGAQELAKGRPFKDAVKATRNQLHQVGGAFQEIPIPYARLAQELAGLPARLEDPAVQAYCRRVLGLHASTRERWPHLAEFYRTVRERVGSVGSVLDLACGLNPLALPWMGFGAEVEYLAVDIYADMLGLVEAFFGRMGVRGRVECVDLAASLPSSRAQLALLLKTLPCLDLLDKTAGARLLDQVQAEHLVVSFPARSLGGRDKGMVQNYSARFLQLVAGRAWRVEQWQVGPELVFWLSR